MTPNPQAASRLAQWLAPLVLGGSLLIGILALVPNAALARGSGSALQYPPNSLNYPPIGAGIETMAAQPGGGYAIVLGNNCTIEILNCTTYTFPYGGNPIQLVILDRTTLTPLSVQTYAGSALDAATAGGLIQTSSMTNKVVVILAALVAGNLTQIDPSWVDVLKLIVQEPGVSFFNGLITNLGGWSAIGVPASTGVPGPVGHLNPGNGDLVGVQHPVGDLTGYMQITSGYTWTFTTGGFASFHTSQSQTPQANTMRINGVDYPSGPLVASNGAACIGGFQLVILNATTFSPLPPAFNVPVNQTFGTNCGSAGTDISQINSVATALSNTINSQQAVGSGASEGGALVFLQSIGNPIVPTQFSPQQEEAARVISPLIEQLGGVADAFNKSWWFAPAPPTNPGYALVGSTALLGDAPSGAQIGVYAAEASSAATGFNPSDPVLLEGLLKRNFLGRYEPVAASPAQGAAPAFLPVTVYQAPQPWPYDGQSSASVKGALAWFSSALNIQYDPTSSCYMPSFPNVRAEYCDTNPEAGLWGDLSIRILTLTYPGEQICNCAYADWKNVRQELSTEMGWVSYIQNGMTVGTTSLASVLTDSGNPSFIDLEAVTNEVLSAVNMSNSSASVAGFWITLASNALKFAANFVVPEFRPAVGVLSTIGPLGENLASLDSSKSLGQVRTTASQLPSELSRRFVSATEQLGLFQSIVLSDYGRLRALGTNEVFQGDPFTDSTLQAQVVNGVQLFAYGRLLGAAYNAYGLLPDSYNPGYPNSPANYFCGNVGDEGVFPFDAGTNAADLSWVGFTYPNLPTGPVPVYDGNPNLLVLASKRSDLFSVYSIPPSSVMQNVVTSSGLGDWPVWFFRHNFTQSGFDCHQLGLGRRPFPFQGKASNVGVRGENGQVRIDTTATVGPIDLSRARLVLGQVLTEPDRAGELVRTAGGSPFLPLVLTAAKGGKPNRATFKTPPGAGPTVTVDVTNRDAKSGRLEVSLTVGRAALPHTADACGADETAMLRTRFVLDDQVHAPVTFNVERPWACKKSKLTTP